MRRMLAAFREWKKPRKARSFWARWARMLVLMVPAWVVAHLVVRMPWSEGLGILAGLSFVLALGEHGYFHVYGGTEAEYPDLPSAFGSRPPAEGSDYAPRMDTDSRG